MIARGIFDRDAARPLGRVGLDRRRGGGEGEGENRGRSEHEGGFFGFSGEGDD